MSSGGQSLGSNNPFRRKPSPGTLENSIISSDTTPADSTSSFDTNKPLTSPTFISALTPTIPAATQPPLTIFKAFTTDIERRDGEQPIQQKPKIVKKVRVQSPPPSPLEETVSVTQLPTPRRFYNNSDSDSDDDSDLSDGDGHPDDPFDNTSTFPNSSGLAPDDALPQMPPNPFARTLEDIEGRNQAYGPNTAATAHAHKGSLDVDSFKRLLLTGHANLPPPSNSAQTPLEENGIPSGETPILSLSPDGVSTADTSSVFKQSIASTPQESRSASRETFESDTPEGRRDVPMSPPLTITGTVSSTPARKKPPPPSSRHGKLIRVESGPDPDGRLGSPVTSPRATDSSSPLEAVARKASFESAVSVQSPQNSTNVNKPLPAPPFRAPAEEDIESPFDREAAGKVPEPFVEQQSQLRPPTPPLTNRSRSGSQASIQSRSKPAAPPPRRHGRGDSRVPSMQSSNADEDPPRSSMESARSRTESLRSNVNSEKLLHAPAPPPPRRPGHTRQGSSFISITHGNHSPAPSPGLYEKGQEPLGSGFTPSAPYNTRPGHSQSPSISTTRVNGQMKLSPPPPPPTRKQSVRRPLSIMGIENSNGLAAMRRVSRDREGRLPLPPPPPPRARGGGRSNADSPTAEGVTQGDEILADLDALQREVDELMKKAGS